MIYKHNKDKLLRFADAIAVFPACRGPLQKLFAPALLGTILVWAYWTTLEGLAQTWLSDPQYSHGFLVPAFAMVLLWQRRADFSSLTLQPSWWGLPLVLIAAVLHVGGGYIYSPWLEQVSLLPALAGACATLGGGRALRVASPAIAFLLFMFPLPGRLDKALAEPLQRISTLASTNALQTFGIFAESEGNVIVLSNYELGIVEACSGLRMLVVFLATSTAVAILARRSLLQRGLIVASAIPIALLCNVIRITTTGIMHETVGHEVANLVYHDVAGWLMVPMAFLFLGLEMMVLSRLFIPVDAIALAGGLGVLRRGDRLS